MLRFVVHKVVQVNAIVLSKCMVQELIFYLLVSLILLQVNLLVALRLESFLLKIELVLFRIILQIV
jgi:hypothetical protein